MRDVLEKEAAKAVREYVEALDSESKLVGRYASLFWEGAKPSTPEPITEAALKELEQARAKVTEARQKWDDAIRKWQSERDAS